MKVCCFSVDCGTGLCTHVVRFQLLPGWTVWHIEISPFEFFFVFCLNSQSRNQKKNREIGWWMFVWFPLLPERSGCDRKHDVACVCAAVVIVVSRCRRCTIRKMRVSRWTDTRYGKPLWVRCAGQQNGRRKGHSWNGMVSEDAAGLITPQAIGFYTVDGSLRRSFRPFRPQTRPFDTNHRKGYHAQFRRYFDV